MESTWISLQCFKIYLHKVHLYYFSHFTKLLCTNFLNLFVSFNKNPMEISQHDISVNMRSVKYFMSTRAPQKSKVANFWCQVILYGDLILREMRQWYHKLMFQLKTEFDFYHQHLQRSFLKPSIKHFLKDIQPIMIETINQMWQWSSHFSCIIIDI